MSTVLVFALSLALAWLALAGVAYRNEYLVVLHWHRSATLFLERQDDARYRQISPWLVPLAVLRFAAYALSLAPAAARQAAARVGSYLPSLVSSKA